MTAAALLLLASCASAALPEIPGRRDLGAELPIFSPPAAESAEMAKLDIDGWLSVVRSSQAPDKRAIAVDLWCRSVEQAVKDIDAGGRPENYWIAVEETVALAESVLKNEKDALFRRWAFRQFFTTLHRSAVARVLRAPDDASWSARWASLGRLRERAQADTDPKLREFMERYAPGARPKKWRELKARARAELDRVVATGLDGEWERAWTLHADMENASLGRLRRARESASKSADKHRREALLAVLEDENARELATLWGTMFPKVLHDMLGPLTGLHAEPVRYGWPDLLSLEKNASKAN